MSDNSYSTVFGPSTPGALNLISGRDRRRLRGQPDRRQDGHPTGRRAADANANGVGTVIGDPDPAFDDCSDTSHQHGNLADDRQEHRRPAQRQGRQLGLVPGRLRPDRGHRHQQGGLRQHARQRGRRGDPATTARTTSRSSTTQSTANPHHLPPRPPSAESATTARPTTSTTWPTSTQRSRRATCRRSPS